MSDLRFGIPLQDDGLPKCGQTINGVRYSHRYQGLGRICKDCGAREPLSGAPELVATTARTILGMHVLREPIYQAEMRGLSGIEDLKEVGVKETLVVATSDGVFVRGDDWVFREVEFRKAGDG